jgi:hypothetical protein
MQPRPRTVGHDARATNVQPKLNASMGPPHPLGNHKSAHSPMHCSAGEVRCRRRAPGNGGTPTGWYVSAQRNEDVASTVTVYVVCAAP